MSASGSGLADSFPPRKPSTNPPPSGGTTSTGGSGVQDSAPPRPSSRSVLLEVWNADSSFECPSHPDFSDAPIGDKPVVGSNHRVTDGGGFGGGLSSLIFRFPLSFVRQLRTKDRHSCSDVAVAQILSASWSKGPAPGSPSWAAFYAQAAAAAVADDVAVLEGFNDKGSVQIRDAIIHRADIQGLKGAPNENKVLKKGILNRSWQVTATSNNGSYFKSKVGGFLWGGATMGSH